MNDYRKLDKLLPRYLRVVYAKGRPSADLTSVSASASGSSASSYADLCLNEVKWLPSFLAIPGNCSLSDIEKSYANSYKALGLFPMDISSALAVLALGLNKSGDSKESVKVLDLCCCPGAKFQMICELLTKEDLVVGVDVSAGRLQVCESLLSQWYKIISEYAGLNGTSGTEKAEKLLELLPRHMLFHADGRTFGPENLGELVLDSNVSIQEEAHMGSRKRQNKSSRNRVNKRLKTTMEQISNVIASSASISPSLDRSSFIGMQDFDYILLDAECTHDASYRHMKFFSESEEHGLGKFPRKDFNGLSDDLLLEDKERDERKVMTLTHNIRAHKTSADGREQLQELQRALLINAYTRLAYGGVLVYSTCSQEVEQNENIIEWLLNQYPEEAVVEEALPYPIEDGTIDLPFISSGDSHENKAFEICKYFTSLENPIVRRGTLPGTIRVGHDCGMSGHFIAKIRKKNKL